MIESKDNVEMKIDAFAVCWNEEKIIGHYIDWYGSFVDSITILDNYSTDKSVEIARGRGCKIIPFGLPTGHDELIEIETKEKCWKSSDADWVIVTDIDELLYHPNLRSFLENTESTVIQQDGYVMVNEKYLPWNEVRMGAKAGTKTVCFRPKSVVRMNWTPGCHTCSPEGDARILVTGEVKLLHFVFVGRKEAKERWKRYLPRRSESDKRHGFGRHYLLSDEEMDKIFDSHLNRAEVVL